MRPRLIRAALVTAVLGLAAPAAAHATLVYQKGTTKYSVWVADDDGSNARKLAGNAGLPRISPDGQKVAYVAHLISRHPSIATKPIAGGPPTEIVPHWGFGAVVWSPDSLHLLAITGSNFKKPNKLKLIDLVSGLKRTIATGFISGMDFSPLGDQIVYGLQLNQKSFPKANLFITPTAGGDTRQLTTDGKSLNPLWGPTSIAYSRYHRPTGKHANQDGPKYNLFLIDPATGMSRQLTHDKVPFLLTGLTPAIWSLDGTKLLADFVGQDTFYGVKVDPVTGEEHKVASLRRGDFKLPVTPTAISDDGMTILGYAGYADSSDGYVITVPYAGGKPKVIVKHAIDPDWTG
ncbi:MAG: tricorn protease [Solirubrobacteraceae bacterium]|jgi:Tol biopolymer transport system component|nr:tricorn protease [Solirubrobacteraceae bacterium]